MDGRSNACCSFSPELSSVTVLPTVCLDDLPVEMSGNFVLLSPQSVLQWCVRRQRAVENGSADGGSVVVSFRASAGAEIDEARWESMKKRSEGRGGEGEEEERTYHKIRSDTTWTILKAADRSALYCRVFSELSLAVLAVGDWPVRAEFVVAEVEKWGERKRKL